MRKLYLISYYFAPLGRADGVNRTYLMKYLSEMGWNIEIVTGRKYKSFVLNFQEDASLLDVLPKSIKIHRFESHNNWLMYDLKKTLHVGNNLRQAWINEAISNMSIDNNGIIYAIVPPIDNAVLAYQLAQKYHRPLVLHYVDDVPEVGRHIVERADLIITATPQIKEAMCHQYGHKKIIFAANGFADPMPLPDKREISLPIKIAYAGSLNFSTRPEIFAQACQKLIKQDPAVAEKLEIDFFGPQGYYASFLLRPHLNMQIRFKGYLSYNNVMHTLAHYDMALASTTGNISFASKTYHYLNAGLPIFGICEHRGLKDFISKHEIGIASDLNIDNVIAKLKMLLANKNKILNWRKNVIKIRDQFDLKSSASKISESMLES